MEEEIITHTGSAITAKDTLAMESGKDIDIKGSKAGGKKVEVKTGNNLSIESLQDSHTYHSRDKESGIHLQRDITARPDTGKKKMADPYFSIGKKTDTTDSTYESVTEQAGIYAGKEGYDIQVKNNTRLKGAVIDSQAEKEKNRITTGTLTWENIDNKAEYKTGGHGISYNGKIGRGDKNDPLGSQTNNRYGKDAITGQRNGMNKITPTIYGSKIPLNERGLLNTPIPSVKGKAETTTTSAVSKGTITITDKENQKQDIEKLNRNTEDSLNKLKEIFDKTKVEEKQELIHMMNIVGNQIIHEAADHYGWKEGSTEKLLLHGAIGALTGTMSGGNALAGAVSGSVNEFALAYMEKTKGRDWMDTHPDTVQAISTALGAVAGNLTGDRATGAYTAQMGTKWNYFAFADALSPARQMAKTLLQKKDGSPATETEIENALRNLNRIMTEQEPEKGTSGFLYAENTNSYNKGIAYLKQEGFTQDSAVSLFKEYNRYLRLGVDWKHPAVRLPGIQLDVDKNHKIINSSSTPEIRMPNENNHLESPHAPEEYHPSKFNMGLSVASGLVVDKTTELPKTLSEYYGYGGTASKIFFKAGGVVGIGMALNDIQKDSRLYSGWNRYKVITADLAPVIFGTALGSIGGATFGMPAVFGLVGGVIGDYTKEYIKAETPTNKEEEVRKYYQEVKNR